MKENDQNMNQFTSPVYMEDGTLNPDYMQRNPEGSELRWKMLRFGPYDTDVQESQGNERANLSCDLSAETFPRRTIGKRKDAARRMRIVQHAIQTASQLQTELDTSERNYLIKRWGDEKGEIHREIVTEETIRFIEANARLMVHALVEQGYEKQVRRVLARHGIIVLPSQQKEVEE